MIRKLYEIFPAVIICDESSHLIEVSSKLSDYLNAETIGMPMSRFLNIDELQDDYFKPVDTITPPTLVRCYDKKERFQLVGQSLQLIDNETLLLVFVGQLLPYTNKANRQMILEPSNNKLIKQSNSHSLAATGNQSTRQLLDSSKLKKLESQIGRSILEKLVSKFCIEATKDYQAIFEADGHEQLAGASHKLISPCQSFGLLSVADELRRIQLTSESFKDIDIQDLKDTHALLIESMKCLSDFMNHTQHK